MAEYRLALPHEEEDILDFVNMVFSQAAVPRHFDTLIPKVYKHPGYCDFHYIAMQKDRIRGLVAMLPVELKMDEAHSLQGGYIGSVAVHERYRGEGHMKVLMDMAVEDAKAKGYDFIGLGGQRQRYNYWNFERCGMNRFFFLTGTNVRHAMKDVDESGIVITEITDHEDARLDAIHALALTGQMICQRPREKFLDVMTSYENHLYAVENAAGELLGYLCGRADALVEMEVYDEAMIPPVLKAWMKNRNGCNIKAPFYRPEWAAYLKKVAERYGIDDSQMFRILNWQRVLEVGLSYRQAHAALPHGRMIVEIENEGRYLLEVDEGVKVAETDEDPDFTFTHREAVSFFFSPYEWTITDSPLVKCWLPLPLEIRDVDKF